MSAVLKQRNKENVEEDKAPRSVDSRLQKLYTEQLARTQEAQHEQERLEMELLAHEKLLLEAQNTAKRANEASQRLAEKFQADAEFLEQELVHYKQTAAALTKKLEKAKAENEQMKLVIGEKDDDMASLNQELEEVLLELKDYRSKSNSSRVSGVDESDGLIDLSMPSSRRENTNSDDDECYEDAFGTQDILLDDEQLGQLSDDEEEDQHLVIDSMNLSGELNLKLEQKNAQLKKLQFEIKSLKNEKSQLYTYVNKLLKNRPSVDQNDVLKQKLVHRKILRAVSVNVATDDIQPAGSSPAKVQKNRYKSKRVVSNFVNLKSYKYDAKMRSRSTLKFSESVFSNNSDDEELDEESYELTLERSLLGFQFIGSGFLMEKSLPVGVTPLHTFLQSVKQTTDDVDLTVD